METEHFDFDELKADRRAAAEESMKAVSHDELLAMRERLFPSVDHPWYSVYQEFVASHRLSPAVHGSASDGYEFIFFPIEKKGLWFKITEGIDGMGPLQDRAIKALSLISAEKKLDI